MTSSPDERLLLFVAHPDDETFGCGSLLAHAATCGVESTVICATRGEAGEPAEGSGVEASALGEVRARELHDAARLLGVDRVELLDWRDSGMVGEPAPGMLVGTPLDDVADRLAPFIDEIRPTVVLTLDASDGHRDHVHMRDATLLAVDRAAWATPRTYLHCLPRELMQEWGENVRRRDPHSAYLAIAELGTPAELITTTVDTSDLLDRREAAIAAHRSQTSPYEAMPAALRAAFLSSERLRRVRPPWNGGPVETELFSPRGEPADPMPG